MGLIRDVADELKRNDLSAEKARIATLLADRASGKNVSDADIKSAIWRADFRERQLQRSADERRTEEANHASYVDQQKRNARDRRMAREEESFKRNERDQARRLYEATLSDEELAELRKSQDEAAREDAIRHQAFVELLKKEDDQRRETFRALVQSEREGKDTLIAFVARAPIIAIGALVFGFFFSFVLLIFKTTLPDPVIATAALGTPALGLAWLLARNMISTEAGVNGSAFFGVASFVVAAAGWLLAAIIAVDISAWGFCLWVACVVGFVWLGLQQLVRDL